MTITFNAQPQALQFLELNYPKEFACDSHMASRKSVNKTSWGALQIEERWFEGVCLLCSEFTVKRKAIVNLKCDSFCWIMSFMLEGELSSETSGQYIHLAKDHYHTFYCPALNTDLELRQNFKVFSICLTRRFIQKLLGKDLLPARFESDGQELLTLVTSDSYNRNRMHLLINEIRQARQPSYIQRIFLEAKILELLSLQLEVLEQKQTAAANFAGEDVNRLQQAKALIEENIKTPCSLIELARKTGLNDFKLKKGFKSLFGNTVFGYLTVLRMETAHRLLEEGKSVGEAADAVGYKNAHHFTAAFKKHFHILPSKLTGQQQF